MVNHFLQYLNFEKGKLPQAEESQDLGNVRFTVTPA